MDVQKAPLIDFTEKQTKGSKKIGGDIRWRKRWEVLLCKETKVENLEFIIYYSGVKYNLHTGAGTTQPNCFNSGLSHLLQTYLNGPHCRTSCTG